MKTSKAEILCGLRQVRKEIIESIHCLPPQRQEQTFLGEWSLKDLLAHFAGWDYANREAIQALHEGRLPAFYAFYDKDWRSYNAQWVETYQNETSEALLKITEISQQALLDALVALPEPEFHQDFGVRFKGYKVTLARLLEAEMEDERTHFKQMLSFLKPGERAEALFLTGYNCSQAVLQAFAPRFGLAQEVATGIATAFGAGISFQGMQCGAVSGALMVIGLQYGNRNAEDKAAKALAYGRSQAFNERFKERHQSVLCRELLGIDLGKPGELERAREMGLFEQVCPGFVREAAEIVSAMLEEE
jgi:C_GCAxxG_C_C family probable redox protein